jgi:hypothetical protein
MDFAGYSIFAHSRPDKIGTPRLLPLYIRNILNGISAKKSAQILYPAIYCCLYIHGQPYHKNKKRLTFGHWNLIIDDYLVIVIWLLVILNLLTYD